MGLETLTPSDLNTYDVVIIGGGPAGLSAALYLARAKKKVCFVEKNIPGGKLNEIPLVTNYPGASNAPGSELALSMYKQAIEAGAKYIYGEVTSVFRKNEKWIAFISRTNTNLFATHIIVAVGKTSSTINIPGVDKYIGKGVSTCVLCDINFCAGKEVVIYTDKQYVDEEIEQIIKASNHTTILYDGPMFNVIDKYKNVQTIKIDNIVEVEGDDQSLTGVTYESNWNNYHLDADFLFYLSKTNEASSDLFNNIAGLKVENNTIVVDQKLQTSLKDIFAVGDVIHEGHGQITIAVSDGANSAINIIKGDVPGK